MNPHSRRAVRGGARRDQPGERRVRRTGGAGPLARTLSVALDGKDPGGYYEITVWSTSGALPDDSVLLGIAEKVLPTLPERTV